ncbi:MAG: hypothetical protein ABI831_04360 [Betaproteobacteria bacterium]
MPTELVRTNRQRRFDAAPAQQLRAPAQPPRYPSSTKPSPATRPARPGADAATAGEKVSNPSETQSQLATRRSPATVFEATPRTGFVAEALRPNEQPFNIGAAHRAGGVDGERPAEPVTLIKVGLPKQPAAELFSNRWPELPLGAGIDMVSAGAEAQQSREHARRLDAEQKGLVWSA